jgi:propanol-preferring alcohol dehydrogenase/NAD+-dependent secondary alcohol dehydrogenase Adh1
MTEISFRSSHDAGLAALVRSGDMRAAQVLSYGKPIEILEVAEPQLRDPYDVIVRIAGAGICRTDVHILHGELDAAFHPNLPLTLGHENSGWVHAVGPAVTHLTIGDPVLVHPAVTCGHCRACRSGNDMHCPSWRFPGVDGWPGGYAELMRSTARSLVRLPAGTDPAPLAPHADAGLTAMHAVRRLVPYISPDSTVVAFGAGGVGQIAVQLLGLLTTARVVVVEIDPNRAEAARRLGAHVVLEHAAPAAASAVRELTAGRGADIVLDLVGEGDVPECAFGMLAKGGVYAIVGYGGGVRIEHLDMINRELTILGNQIGTHADLVALMDLVAQGRVAIDSTMFPLDAAADVLHEVEAGRVSGRAVLVP